MNETDLQWEIYRAVMLRDHYLFKADQEQRILNALYEEQDAQRILKLCHTGKPRI